VSLHVTGVSSGRYCANIYLKKNSSIPNCQRGHKFLTNATKKELCAGGDGIDRKGALATAQREENNQKKKEATELI
jgi:hypothetical protein